MVQGLMSFVNKQVPETKRKNVKMVDEISKSSKKLIVIDLLNILHEFANINQDKFYAGRFQFAFERAKNFCQQLEKVGAKLAFFIDGRVQDEKIDFWLEKQKNIYEKSIEALRIMESGEGESDLWENATKYPFTTALVLTAECTIRGNRELVRSYDVDCDLAMAKYATENDALAVLSGDSDFFIFEGNWKIWGDLNLENASVSVYDKKIVRDHLGLSQVQMKYLATLAGNDFIRPPRNLRFTFMTKFSVLSDYLKQNKLDHDGKFTNEVLRSLYGFDKISTNFHKSLQCYDINYKVRNVDTSKETEKWQYQNYILKDIPGRLRLFFLDLNLLDYQAPLIEMYRRQCGVVLKNQMDPNLKRSLYITQPVGYPFKKIVIDPIYPNLVVPPLDGLRPNSGLSDSIKMDLLRWLILEDSYLDINGIPKEYLMDILTLCFLMKYQFITYEEADIILICIDHVIKGKVPVIPYVEYPRKIKENVALTFLYTIFYERIYGCATIVGLDGIEDIFVCKFDGVYFNQLLIKLRKDGEARERELFGIHHLRIY